MSTHAEIRKWTLPQLAQAKRDGRKLDHKTLEEIRLMAVERVRDGEKPSAVIAAYGFSRTTIYKWLKASRPLNARGQRSSSSMAWVPQTSTEPIRRMCSICSPSKVAFGASPWNNGCQVSDSSISIVGSFAITFAAAETTI